MAAATNPSTQDRSLNGFNYVSRVRRGFEHQWAAPVDHTDALLSSSGCGPRRKRWPAPKDRCIQTCLMPRSAQSRMVAIAGSGRVPMSTA